MSPVGRIYGSDFNQIRDTHFYATNNFLKYFLSLDSQNPRGHLKWFYLLKMVSFGLDFLVDFNASKNVLGFVRL